MIVGAHVVLSSKDPEGDRRFLREVLNLSSIGADGSYEIFALPKSEASIHETGGEAARHELYFLCDDINAFVEEMKSREVECSPTQDTGWGILVEIKLPSGAPLHVYQPRHERP